MKTWRPKTKKWHKVSCRPQVRHPVPQPLRRKVRLVPELVVLLVPLATVQPLEPELRRLLAGVATALGNPEQEELVKHQARGASRLSPRRQVAVHQQMTPGQGSSRPQGTGTVNGCSYHRKRYAGPQNPSGR